ncbi:MAG: InlB B-repeat-containing protein, partial [Raoultibacter sp.]
GIGCASGYYTKGGLKRIAISGGFVEAKGGEKGVGIGSNASLSTAGVQEISITGGTVIAQGGNASSYDFGGVASKGGKSAFYISGGNVKAAKGVQGQPLRNKGGAEVYPNKIMLENYGASLNDRPFASVAKLEVEGGYDYGVNNMQLFDSAERLWVWLPADKSVLSTALDRSYLLSKDVRLFSGPTTAKAGGTLFPCVKATLVVGGVGKNGSALLRQGLSEAFEVKHATRVGQTLLGYSSDLAGSSMVINADGSLIANVEGITDSEKRFIGTTQATFENDLRLYAQWQASNYTMRFDKNAPLTASHEVAGSVADQLLSHDVAANLSRNNYSLVGWTFMGWNTKADGSGTAYADQASVLNLTDEDGAIIVLYAQWQAQSYKVTFESGESAAVGSMSDHTLFYDTPSKLPANAFSFAGNVFMGWSKGSLGNFYNDEATVTNLGALKTDGTPENVTLTAQWVSAGNVRVTVTLNEEPVDGVADSLVLVRDGTEFSGFTGKNGTYDIAGMASGTYDVRLNGWLDAAQKVEVSPQGTGVVFLQYASVGVSGENATPFIVDPTSGRHVEKVEKVPLGSELEIGLDTLSEGYHFQKWTACGVEPAWSAGTTAPQQTITLAGQVILEAHGVANRYQVVFDANCTDATGTPAIQEMVYNEAQKLLANPYSREGYEFAGWTLSEAWTGKLYANEEQVLNLTAREGSKVVLYAQWVPHGYFLNFEPNGASGLMLDQKVFFGNASTLSPLEYEWENWHFTGWNTKPDGSGDEYADEQEIRDLAVEEGASVSFYAQWEHDTFFVTMDPNGASGAPQTLEVWTHSGFCVPLCDFVWPGYTFEGWNTARDGSGLAYAPGSSLDSFGVVGASSLTEQAVAATSAGEALVLYAQWKAEVPPEPEPVPVPVPIQPGAD